MQRIPLGVIGAKRLKLTVEQRKSMTAEAEPDLSPSDDPGGAVAWPGAGGMRGARVEGGRGPLTRRNLTGGSNEGGASIVDT